MQEEEEELPYKHPHHPSLSTLMDSSESSPPPTGAYVYIDVETTGCPGGAALLSPFHRVVQLSAVVGRPLPRTTPAFDTPVQPHVHVPAASAAIHGWDDAALAHAPSFEAAWTAFETWIATVLQPTGPVTLVAHNMFGFDAVVLAQELRRAFPHREQPWDPTRYVLADTLEPVRRQVAATAAADTDPAPASLGSWYRRVTGQTLEGAHNALADVQGLRTAVETSGLVPSTTVTWPDDTAVLTALRYVGPTRAKRLYDYMATFLDQWAGRPGTPPLQGPARTVGAVRYAAATLGSFQGPLEKILRDVVHVFDDDQCEAIVAQVLRRGPSERQPLAYPYLVWPAYRAATRQEQAGFRAMGLRTRGAVRDHYLYTCAEDAAVFAADLVARGGFRPERAASKAWRMA